MLVPGVRDHLAGRGACIVIARHGLASSELAPCIGSIDACAFDCLREDVCKLFAWKGEAMLLRVCRNQVGNLRASGTLAQCKAKIGRLAFTPILKQYWPSSIACYGRTSVMTVQPGSSSLCIVRVPDVACGHRHPEFNAAISGKPLRQQTTRGSHFTA